MFVCESQHSHSVCSVFVIMTKIHFQLVFSLWFIFLQINHQPVIQPKHIEQVLNVSNASPQKDHCFFLYIYIYSVRSFRLFICSFSLRLIYLSNIKVFGVCVCFFFAPQCYNGLSVLSLIENHTHTHSRRGTLNMHTYIMQLEMFIIMLQGSECDGETSINQIHCSQVQAKCNIFEVAASMRRLQQQQQQRNSNISQNGNMQTKFWRDCALLTGIECAPARASTWRSQNMKKKKKKKHWEIISRLSRHWLSKLKIANERTQCKVWKRCRECERDTDRYTEWAGFSNNQEG